MIRGEFVVGGLRPLAINIQPKGSERPYCQGTSAGWGIRNPLRHR
jgi:hypothetical protein